MWTAKGFLKNETFLLFFELFWPLICTKIKSSKTENKI